MMTATKNAAPRKNNPKQSSRPAAKRILIADDHPVVREGIGQILSLEPDMEVCGKAATVTEALALVEKLKPDLVMTDLTFPERSGLELIKDLKVLCPEIPVLVMSMHDEMIYAERIFRAGGRGYLMKEIAGEFVVQAIRKILDGGVYASSAVTDHFLESMSGVGGSGGQKASFPLGRLTDRELEIFEQLGNGKDSHEIAESLGISPRTVDAHRSHIREKLGLSDSAELTRYAVRWIESGALE